MAHLLVGVFVVGLAAVAACLAVRWCRAGVTTIRQGHRLTGVWVGMVGLLTGLLAVAIAIGIAGAMTASKPRASQRCREAHRVASQFGKDASNLRKDAPDGAFNSFSSSYDVTRLQEWQHTVDLWANVVTNDPHCFSPGEMATATDWLRHRN